MINRSKSYLPGDDTAAGVHFAVVAFRGNTTSQLAHAVSGFTPLYYRSLCTKHLSRTGQKSDTPLVCVAWEIAVTSLHEQCKAIWNKHAMPTSAA